ncbi:MFS transporter [Chromobacterium sp. IIBBL 290-4]|uniref:MFS transporter n=1 Tax=Chromobacterium sp. IIBBL 290-4 TaxID=2953890 RepID=UPI0020B70D55|nr:MFS transporter [Chromobacterium sp. IIBBL 290-4]UTH75710.1 MFS transporter [Chromobacterium sp. IIBBL 290-4]
MPAAIYLLSLCIFAMATSEFMVAGMMPSLAAAFHISLAEVGNLVSAFAASVVVGGPLLTLRLRALRRKPALLGLLALFLIGQLIGASADSYAQMLASRIVCGVAQSAFFGVALALAGELVGMERIARAAGLVLNGLMLASVAGLPMATLLDQRWGWRLSFWLVAALVGLAMLGIAARVPAGDKPAGQLAGEEWRALARPALWAAYLSSGLIIGAVFAAFTYLAPLLLRVSGFSPAMVPLLFGVYGAATVLGNLVTGRLADRHTRRVLQGGVLTLFLVMLALALGAQWQALAVAGVCLLGLAGLPMNPAMVARVVRAGGAGPMVNSLHMAVVNLGLMFGAWAGGLCLDAGWGLRAPLWLGAALALLAWLSLGLDRSGNSWRAKARPADVSV